MHISRKALVASVTVTVVLAAGGTTLAAAGNTPLSTTEISVPLDPGGSLVAAVPPAPNPVAAVEPAASKAFPVLRNEPATPMPADVAAEVGSPTLYGRNPKLARAIDTETGRGWVIPGRGFICVAVPDPIDGWGTSCAPTDVAATQGVMVKLVPPNAAEPATVTTVAPTGTETVIAKAGAATATVLPTDEGVSSVSVPVDTAVLVTP